MTKKDYYTKEDRVLFSQMVKVLEDVATLFKDLPAFSHKKGRISILDSIIKELKYLGTPPKPKVVKIIELASCGDCPHKKTKHTEGTGYGQDWLCGKMNNKEIAGYIEWSSEEPKSIPKWCPLTSLPEPLPWYQEHDKDCGLKYRGCAPYCKKDLIESFQSYIIDLLDRKIALTDKTGAPLPLHTDTLLKDHRKILVESWLNSKFEADAPIYRTVIAHGDKEFRTAEEVQDAYDNGKDWAVAFVEEILKYA